MKFVVEWTIAELGIEKVGRNRGGWGYWREWRIETDELEVSMFMERERIAPHGLFGGHDGPTSAILVSRDRGASFETFGEAFGVIRNAKFSGIMLKRGDIVRVMIPGGGGYGAPGESDFALIEEDLRQEYISAADAERDYGVAIEAHGVHANHAATAALRPERSDPEPSAAGR